LHRNNRTRYQAGTLLEKSGLRSQSSGSVSCSRTFANRATEYVALTGRELFCEALRLFDGFRQLGRRTLHAEVLFFTALSLRNDGNVLFRLFLMAAIDAEKLTVL